MIKKWNELKALWWTNTDTTFHKPELSPGRQWRTRQASIYMLFNCTFQTDQEQKFVIGDDQKHERLKTKTWQATE